MICLHHPDHRAQPLAVQALLRPLLEDLDLLLRFRECCLAEDHGGHSLRHRGRDLVSLVWSPMRVLPDPPLLFVDEPAHDGVVGLDEPVAVAHIGQLASAHGHGVHLRSLIHAISASTRGPMYRRAELMQPMASLHVISSPSCSVLSQTSYMIEVTRSPFG